MFFSDNLTRKNIKQKTLVFFCGLLSILVVIEIVLRLIGFIHISYVNKAGIVERKQGEHVIFCAGDSFTEGIGADNKKSYPDQLQDLLDKRLLKRECRVINIGVSGHNTSLIRNEINSSLRKIKPHLIVFLGGDANSWNAWGYGRYLKQKILFYRFLDFLHSIKVVKLMKLLVITAKDRLREDKFKKEKVNIDPENYLVAHKIKGWNYIDHNQYDMAIKWFKKAIEESPNDNRNYYGLAWTYVGQKNYSEAILWFEKCAQIGLIVNSCCLNIASIRNIINRLGREADDFLYGICNCYIDIAKIIFYFQEDYDTVFRWLEECIEKYPDNASEFYVVRANFYLCLQDYDKVLQCMAKLTDEKSRLDLFFEIGLKRDILVDGGSGIYFKDFIKMLRNAKKHSNEIKLWAASDIDEIIKLCKKEEIRIIIQNYPIKSDMNIILERVARKHLVPFVDNRLVFRNLLSEREEQNDYFVSDGHCNNKGYAIMAENIFNKIIELNMFDSQKTIKEKNGTNTPY